MEENNIQGGYILLARQILKSEIWNKPAEYLKIFLYILLKANHDDKDFPRGTNLFNFNREVIPKVTKNQIYKFLAWSRQENDNILATEKATRGIVIKVNNYDRFQTTENYYRQDERHKNGTKTAQKRLHYKQERKKEKKENNNNIRSFFYSKSFLEWYEEYPRKQSKKKAAELYMKALKDGATAEQLLDGVKGYNKYIAANSLERRYIKMPTTWLNQGCWEDDYTVKSTSILDGIVK